MPDKVERIETAFMQLSKTFVRALRQAAVAEGLDDEMSDRITRRMILGSVDLLRTTEQSPVSLIARVASKGGTTEAGLRVMDAPDGVDAIVASTLARAMDGV